LIPLPPVAEQLRIVNEIDNKLSYIKEISKDCGKISELIGVAKSKILDLAISGKLVPQDPNDEPAIELLKRMNPGFEPCDNSHYENLPENWCLAKVKDVFVINPRNKAEDNTVAGFIPMTLIDDGYSNTFSYEKRKWGSIKTGFTHFADGDVAVAKISPCLENRKSIVLRDLPNGIGAGTTELHVFRSSVVVPEYALYFFKSEYFISKCVGTFNGVVGQQRVGKNIIEEIQIPIPPINEQTKIVSTIETIFTQLNTITAEL
jgi:type I restriction enzyme S subunit